MSALPEPMHTIASLIDEQHQNKQEPPRPHMGASQLGHACDRWLWLSFRWAVIEPIKGRILRLFRRGSMEEDTAIQDLKSIGVDVRNYGQNQKRVDFGCHVSGSIDGEIVSGVPGAEKTAHNLEIKTHNKKSFDDLEKNGVEKSKPMHFAQMQVYMLGSGKDRSLYYAVAKDDDRIYTERVKLDKDRAEKYVERGKRLALADSMPPPLSTDSTWYECRLCPGHNFCHLSKKTKQINCRTCAFSTAKEDSTWHCTKYNDTIPLDTQRTGCEAHVLHPDLVPWKLRTDLSEDFAAAYEIDGKVYKNGEGHYASSEMLVDGFEKLDGLRTEFEGKIIQ